VPFVGILLRIRHKSLVIAPSAPSDQAVDSAGRGCPALDENIVVSNAPSLLAQFCCKHLLHECLAAQVGHPGLSSEEWVGPGCSGHPCQEKT